MSDPVEPQDAGVTPTSDSPRGEPLRAPEGVQEAFVSMNADGVIVDWNEEAERTFGYTRSEVLGTDLGQAILPERYRAAHWAAVQRFLTRGEAAALGQRLELIGMHRDGHEIPVELRLAFATYAAAGPDRLPEVTFHAFVYDISARRLSEQVLIAMQSVTQAMARAQSSALAMEALLVTLGQNMGWSVASFWSHEPPGVLRRVAGWQADTRLAAAFAPPAELAEGAGFVGHTFASGTPTLVADLSAQPPGAPHHEAAVAAGLRAAIGVPVVRAGTTIGVLEFLAPVLRARGRSIVEALASVGEQAGELMGILDERQALLARLEHLALTDQLTALPNRRAWEQGLLRELARAARDTHPVCVVVLDLDGFKHYNDRHGHQAGDALLQRAAGAWLGELRAGDLLARYGGDEFAALITSWPLETVVAIVERLRGATPSGQTASAGVACWDHRESARTLFARADAALYEAKQLGRDRTVALT